MIGTFGSNLEVYMGYYIEKKIKYEMKGFKSKDIRPTFDPVYPPLVTN